MPVKKNTGQNVIATAYTTAELPVRRHQREWAADPILLANCTELSHEFIERAAEG
jgi:hypothetical protein